MHRWIVGSCVLAALIWTRGASAETGGDRTLGGHTFIEPQTQMSAMITSHAGIRQGVLFRRIPEFPLGPLGTLTLMQTGADEVLDGGVKATDWLGFYGRMHVRVHAGINAESILLLPTYTTFDGEAGSVVRLGRWEDTGTQLSLRLGGDVSRGYVLHLSALLREVITSVDQGNVQTFSDIAGGDIAKYVLWPTEGLGGRAVLHGAQALGPNVSLQLSLGLRLGRSSEHPYRASEGARVDVDATERAIVGAGAFTVDGGPSGFPVAAVGEWRATRNSVKRSGPGVDEDTTETQHVLAGGLYYSGRENLQLGVGLETVLNQKPEIGFDEGGGPADSGKPTTLMGSFTLRYVW